MQIITKVGWAQFFKLGPKIFWGRKSKPFPPPPPIGFQASVDWRIEIYNERCGMAIVINIQMLWGISFNIIWGRSRKVLDIFFLNFRMFSWGIR